MDVVFDRYDKPCSIKCNERERRGASSALEIKIIRPSTPVAKQWNTSIIHNIEAISLHSCHILGAKSVNKNCSMQHGQVLVMGGGFEECNKAVLVVHLVHLRVL